MKNTQQSAAHKMGEWLLSVLGGVVAVLLLIFVCAYCNQWAQDYSRWEAEVEEVFKKDAVRDEIAATAKLPCAVTEAIRNGDCLRFQLRIINDLNYLVDTASWRIKVYDECNTVVGSDLVLVFNLAPGEARLESSYVALEGNPATVRYEIAQENLLLKEPDE